MLAYVRRDNQAMLHIFENFDFVRQPSDSLEEVVLCRILESTDQNLELIWVLEGHQEVMPTRLARLLMVLRQLDQSFFRQR